MPPTGGRARTELRERLEARREEIEAALLARTHSIADPAEAADPGYAESLRRAVTAALDHGLAALDFDERRELPVPVDLLAQARLAARNGVGLDTVLRRYFAGYSLFGFFLIEEAGRGGLVTGQDLQRLTASQARRFDRLIATIGEEHSRERQAGAAPSRRQQLEQIRRLLDGETVDVSAIPYELGGWHVGIALDGPKVESVLSDLSTCLDCRVLHFSDGRVQWAWLGGRQRLDAGKIATKLVSRLSDGCACALGEPGEGLAGWRLTHHQARTAMGVRALRGGTQLVRYADVALLAAVLEDKTAVASLRQSYLKALEAERDGGVALRETLRAYFATDRSHASTAITVGVSPRTVRNRLRRAEEAIGRPLHTVLSELEIALKLDELAPVGTHPESDA